MDDSSYQKALQRRQQLQLELAEVEEFIRLYQRLFREQSGGLNPPQPASEASDTKEGARRRERNIIPPRRLAEMARERILAAGRPLTRSELVEVFERDGIPLAGADKSKNIGTIMWRFRDEFENIPGRGYWPIGVPLKGHLL